MSYQEGWYEEMQSAYLYGVLAGIEMDPEKRNLFKSLGEAALSQATLWEDRMRQEGISLPVDFRPAFRARLVSFLIRRLGPRRILPVLAAMKVRGISIYSGASVSAGHVMPKTLAEVGGRHRSVGRGGNLRAAVFGVNDGLVSNASLIMGMAGASGDSRVILISGIAGLLAGAFSMAAGEYVSVRSQRELYEYQIGLEREELALYPEEEREELALIYNARGLTMDQARHVSGEMLKDPDHALETLAREELGLNPDDLGSPWGAAISSFLSFGAGALVPLGPFVFAGNTTAALPISIALTAAGLFAVGSALSLFSGKNAWRGGLRMTLIGASAGAATYLIGTLLGVSLP